MNYPPTAPYPQQYPKTALGQTTEVAVERDPREEGAMIARLQVASEMVARLRMRLSSIADSIHDQNGTSAEPAKAMHMNLLRFPDDIIADARCADSMIDRIQGALGI